MPSDVGSAMKTGGVTDIVDPLPQGGANELQTVYNFGILGNSHCRCNSLVVHPVPLM